MFKCHGPPMRVRTHPDPSPALTAEPVATARPWSRLTQWLPAFLGAAAARVAYWVFVTPHYVPIADADQYRRLGRSLAAGDGYQLVYPRLADDTALHASAFRPPLYPLILAPGFKVFGTTSLWPARLTSVLLGSLVVVLAGVLAARVAGRTAGWVTAGVVAVYPPLLANDTIVMTESLALALLLAAVLLVDSRRWVLAGVVTGLLVLTRPNIYLVIAILAFWAWRTMGLRRAAGLLGCCGLVVLPWLVRNQLQVGTFRPTTSDGLTLAAIYAEPAQEADTFIDPVFAPVYNDPAHVLQREDEAKWNNLLVHEALSGLRSNPGYVGRVMHRNYEGYFELDTSLNRFAEDSDGRNWRFRQDVLPFYVVVTVLGLAGLMTRWRHPLLRVLALIVAQFVLLSLILVAPPRLRAPFDLAMCVGVGLLVATIVERRSRTGRTASSTAGPPPDQLPRTTPVTSVS